MLKGTNFWTNGEMHLWVNNEPAKVYVPKSNVKEAYDIIQSRLSKEGSIPIGIDHLPDNIIEANPILAKLDLLNVGEITDIEYADDTISIVEAKLTNPLIKQLYEAGELDMVSIVATSNVSECPNDYDYIVNSTDITRVDIVEKGACPTCNIPKPHDDDDTVVYARYTIKEEQNMSDELTPETIQTMLDEVLKPINERLDKQDKAIEDIKTSIGDKGEGEGEGQKPADDKVDEKVEARIAELKRESATAQVNMAIMAGKVAPAQKESMIELCAKDSEEFAKLMEVTPVTIPLDQRKSLLAGTSDDDDDDDTLTPEEENLNAVLNHFGGE